MARIVVQLSLNSLEAVEGTCDQRRLWSACADAQADLSLRWSHKSYCRFSRALAQIYFNVSERIRLLKCLRAHAALETTILSYDESMKPRLQFPFFYVFFVSEGNLYTDLI